MPYYLGVMAGLCSAARRAHEAVELLEVALAKVGETGSAGLRRNGIGWKAYSGTPAFFNPSMNASQWAKLARFRRSTLSRTGGPSLLRAAMYSRASSIKPRCPQQLISEWYWPTCSDAVTEARRYGSASSNCRAPRSARPWTVV